MCKKIIKKFTFYGYCDFLLVVLVVDFLVLTEVDLDFCADLVRVFFRASAPGSALVPNFLRSISSACFLVIFLASISFGILRLLRRPQPLM